MSDYTSDMNKYPDSIRIAVKSDELDDRLALSGCLTALADWVEGSKHWPNKDIESVEVRIKRFDTDLEHFIRGKQFGMALCINYVQPDANKA